MNLQKFTVKAQEAVQKAVEIAQGRSHQGLEPPHLLKAFLADPNSIVMTMLQKLGANTDFLNTKADQALDKLPVVTGSSVSGLYFQHPRARYFTVGRLDRDQVADYATRMGIELEVAERWLSPNLGYDPDA